MALTEPLLSVFLILKSLMCSAYQRIQAEALLKKLQRLVVLLFTKVQKLCAYLIYKHLSKGCLF